VCSSKRDPNVSILPGAKVRPRFGCTVVRENWALANRGKVIQNGTGDANDIGTWSQDRIERELGTFWLQRDQSYTTRFQSLDDGRVLAPADPYLKIEIESDFYEDAMFTSYFLFTWSMIHDLRALIESNVPQSPERVYPTMNMIG
jgi:hypothetical protein